MPSIVREQIISLAMCAPPNFPRICLEPIAKELHAYQKHLRAVKKDGMNLKNVPREHQTRELCEAAIAQDPESLQFVLEQTEELCALALLLGRHGSDAYKTGTFGAVSDPTEFLLGLALGTHDEMGIEYDAGKSPLARFRGRQRFTHVIFANTIIGDGIDNDDIDERWRGHPVLTLTWMHRKTEDMMGWLKSGHATSSHECFEFVRCDSHLLKFVPAHLQTEEMCAYALARNIENLPFIANLTPFLLAAALGMDPMRTMELVREQTPLLCRLAVYATSGVAMSRVQNPFVTRELITDAFNLLTDAEPKFDDSGNVLNWWELYNSTYETFCVPTCILTEKLVLEFFDELYGYSLDDVPEELRTGKVCHRAVSSNGHELKHVPKHLITQELCDMAVTDWAHMLEYVPTAYKTLSMCISALERNSGVEQFIPREFLDVAERVEQVRKKRRTK